MFSMAKKVSGNTAYTDAEFKAEEISLIQRILMYFHLDLRRKQYIKKSETASV